MRLPTGGTQKCGLTACIDRFAKIGKRMRGSAGYESIKRVLDVVLSTLALILLSPAFFLFMGLIVLDDPGCGPIYVSERVGMRGKRFRLYLKTIGIMFKGDRI